MKVCVLNYTGDRSNWGCQATSRNLVRFLREKLAGDGTPVIETVPLPLHHRLDDHTTAGHGERLRRIYAAPCSTLDDLAFLEDLARERFGDLCNTVADADLVVFQGEGSIGPRSYLGNARLFALPFLAARRWRRPVVAMNLTIYAADRSDIPVLANVFSAFDAVAVREARSYAFASDIGLDRVMLCPDMAFATSLSGEFDDARSAGQGTFVVSGSAASECFYPKRLLTAVRRIADTNGLMPVLIWSRKADRMMFQQAAAAFGDTPFKVLSSGDYPDFRQVLPVLREARFVLGGRYHTAVSALGEGTPVILLPGNTFKSEGLAPMLGLDLPVFRPGDVAGIVEAAGRILAAGEDLRDQISEAVSSLCDAQGAFGTYIRNAFLSGVFDHAPSTEFKPEPAVFPASGPHDAIYRASNTGHPGGASRIARCRLERLRRDPNFTASVRDTFGKFTAH